ncbi:UAA transporter [Panaeolus papilionaceus]|nr:UAA transporter [Panaeolus papilionaceus]
MSVRRKSAPKSAITTEQTLNGTASDTKKSDKSNVTASSSDKGFSVSQVAPALFDFYTALSLVLGGCCSNVVSYEQLLIMNPRIGSALTFSQMLFITLQSLPSFLQYDKLSHLPRLKPRQVPLSQWALQVVLVISGSLLNNWAYAYNVPLTILIVFRSAGLPVSMLFGRLFLKKSYSILQIFSVFIVTFGVILVTLSRTSSSTTNSDFSKLMSPEDLKRYIMGIGMMVISLLCTGLLGILQELTYGKYGPCWKEGVFYTHFLSLPVFLFLGSDVKQGISSLVQPGSTASTMRSFAILGINLLTQLACVSGVNRLSSQVSSVSTNIALTVRKALSLCFSVWWFGNPWNAQLGSGALMVFVGSLLYTVKLDGVNKKD